MTFQGKLSFSYFLTHKSLYCRRALWTVYMSQSQSSMLTKRAPLVKLVLSFHPLGRVEKHTTIFSWWVKPWTEWIAYCCTFRITCLVTAVNTAKIQCSHPGWCGSVDWVQAYKLKGRRFYCQEGHMPGLQARSSFGGHVRGKQSMFLSHINVSLPLFLPPFLSL